MVPTIRPKRPLHFYIKEHRKKAGLTLEQLGGRILTEESPNGVDKGTVSRWENEQWRLNNEKIAAIAAAIGLEDSRDLLRPPGKPSLDAMADALPANMQQMVVDIIARMKAS